MPIKKNLEAIHDALELVLIDRRAQSASEKFEVLKELSVRFSGKCVTIHYQASHLSQTFALFETLNDRGMQVASSDLIKNLCMKYLPSHMNGLLRCIRKTCLRRLLRKRLAFISSVRGDNHV